MTNEEKLDKAAGRIRQERIDFLAQMEGLSQNQLDFKPSPESWSIGEVAHHVGLTEQLLQDNVKELLRTGDETHGVLRRIGFDELPMGPAFLPNSLLRLAPFRIPFAVLNNFLPSSVQSFILANPVLKIRTAPAVQPKAGIPAAPLLEFLHELREATLRLLEPVKDRDLSRFRWQHPLMGTHDVYETLELLANHDRRHRTQIEQVKKSPQFPAS